MIGFFKDNYRWLSNFWSCDVILDGVTYPSTEHAYQAAKTLNTRDRAMIADVATPGQAKKMGFAVELRKDWEDIKLDVMEDLLRQKFSFDGLSKCLLATGNEEIVEGNWWHDNYWGTCHCDRCGNKGKNNLGKLIMKIRESMKMGTDILETIFSTDVLECETSRGNKKFWQGHVCTKDGKYYTRTSYWQEIKDGLSKKQFSELVLIAGKNVGRANETTDKQQAFSELESATNKQKDKGYHAEGEKSNSLPLQMLAHKYKDYKHRLVGKNLCVQPKIDGSRQAYCSKRQVMWSRMGKPCIPQVCAHLRFDTKGYMVDGELVLPKPYTFQQTMSATKRFQIAYSPKLEFHLFDIIDETKPFRERLKILEELVTSANNSKVKLVPTYEVNSEEEIMAWHDKFIAEGDEGVIIRDLDAPYKIGHRNISLQKFKVFEDDEFEIVDIEDGKGKNTGVAKFVCKTKEGKLFEAEYNAPMEERKLIFQNKDKYIGKMLTVRYQEMSDDNIPRFNKGISIRDAATQG